MVTHGLQETERKNQGGGVAVVVRNDLISKVRTIDKVENENIEILWVEIKTGKNNKNLAVGMVYIMAHKKMKTVMKLKDN